MTQKKQPIHSNIDNFVSQWDDISTEFAIEVNNNINAGKTVADSVNIANKGLQIQIILETSIASELITIADEQAKGSLQKYMKNRRWWLNNNWPGEKLTLSERITDLVKWKQLKEELNQLLKQGRSWVEIARSFTKKKFNAADIAQNIIDLENAAKRVMKGGTLKDYAEYTRAIRKSKRYIERLAMNDSPTQRLKKAYASVIKATEQLSTKAIDKAIQRAVKAKSNYNAARIARTEMAKAYSQGIYQRALVDGDVSGIQYSLSARHKIFDICDFHTSADIYGMGKGKYPLKALPKYPFHPHCTCILTYLYDEQAGKRNEKAAVAYINKLSEAKKQLLLGKNGAEHFNKNNKAWKSELNNYQGHKNIKSLIEKK